MFKELSISNIGQYKKDVFDVPIRGQHMYDMDAGDLVRQAHG